jgi:hypothetical protein
MELFVTTFRRVVKITHSPALLYRKLLPHKRQERDDGLSLSLGMCGTLPANPSYADSTKALARSSVTGEIIKAYKLKKYYRIIKYSVPLPFFITAKMSNIKFEQETVYSIHLCKII